MESTEMSPKINSMHIETTINNRFAKTLITSKVKNTKNKAEETTFSVILPENAFISEFEMEIDGKIYKAYVKEKEEAKTIYTQAVSSGFGAAHVELNARDSKKFTVSVNIEPSSETIFRLTYEELLQRQNGQYELIINVHPGQILDDLRLEVKINETRPLTFVKTLSLRTGNEISEDKPELDPCAQTEILNPNSAKVKFNPDKEQQKKYAEALGSKDKGLAGQFVVQYDVERDPKGGEVLLRDGYFVHFFAPSDLKTLPKHVVFVLDHSGSMMGRKIEQLMQAMDKILSDLNPEDLFHIVRFSDNVSVWNLAKNKFDEVYFTQQPDYENLDSFLTKLELGEATPVTEDNIKKAKKIKGDNVNMGSTNISGGLVVGLFLVRRTLEKFYEKNFATKYQPMIIFLTDGLPNVGISHPDQITKIVTKINQGTNRAAIYSLSFGEDADKNFLKKLSAQNLGFSRHIYEAADASLQLQSFYRTVSSPLLRDVRFKYVDEVSDVTRIDFPIFFLGSEFIVAGRCWGTRPLRHIEAFCLNGCVEFETQNAESDTSLERLWAYLTVKQLLDERETAENRNELTKKALNLALKYSFVTSITSLVVVKPQQNDSTDYESAATTRQNFYAPNYQHCSAPSRACNNSFASPAMGMTFGAMAQSYSSPIKLSSYSTSRSDRLYSASCFQYAAFGSPNTFQTTNKPLFNFGINEAFSGSNNKNTFQTMNKPLFNFGINEAFSDSNNKEKIEILINWINTTQPHLPQINDSQANLFLHCCDFNEETAKNVIDSCFTIRTLCPEFFTGRDVSKSPLKESLDVALITFLPEKTPHGEGIIFVKLLDQNPDNFDFVAILKYFDMVCSLYLNKEKLAQEYLVILDLDGLTKNHLNKFETSVLKKFLCYVQQAIPLKVKGIYCLNNKSFCDDIMALIKPFIRTEIVSKVYFHNDINDLLINVPMKCLPEEYGGSVKCKLLHEKNKKQLYENILFFKEEEKQVVDESKRVAPQKVTKYDFN
ncbi:inter-alpha-trypsin inhibitor heavy chain H4-like [Tribolium madens]|uniref:inter-alpha-trypsin inhibitor heavy chain H4-like n=1 Tax=Tribolium madens TaxID=41895 RepID=UPI001CF758B5|nr:inter-alpha-trypsin inhibitor heavy chain H4-like [Tribolium madens]